MILALLIGATLLTLGIALGPERVHTQLRRLMRPRTPLQTADILAPDFEPIEHRLKELSEHIEAVRSLAEDRRHEVARLREGHDFSVTRSFARGVIKTIDLLRDCQARLSEAHADSDVLKDALRHLEAGENQLCFLLEANQIEPFTPEPGDPIEAESLRFEPVEKHPAPTPSDVGKVSEVKHPGWILLLGDSQQRVIRPAQIAVYSPADNQNGSTPS